MISKNLGDFHTHTVYSLHGMSSPSEIVDAAIKKGLKYVAITDHYYPSDPSVPNDNRNHSYINQINQKNRIKCIREYFSNQLKIYVIPGYEYSFFTDVDDRPSEGLKLCGIHSWFVPKNAKISEVASDIYNGYVDILCHPERGIDLVSTNLNRRAKYEILFTACKEANIPVEFNTKSTAPFMFLSGKTYDWITQARKYELPIVVNSDSHIHYTVGELDIVIDWLKMIYPESLIVNLNDDLIRKYITSKQNIIL